MNVEAQIKKGRKYDQVIRGARAVFLREGFEGASVDTIARDAGVSKATLYSYFPDKQHLFLEVLRRECLAQSEVDVLFEQPELSVERKLGVICEKLITFFLSDFGQEVFRVCMAEAKRFPELGQTFYESGPKTWTTKISGFLASDKAQDVLLIEDPDLAADQLAQLCRTDLVLKVMFGIVNNPSQAKIDRIADEAVKTFLARYQRQA